MFPTQCLDCRTDVTFSEQPGEAVCPKCRLRQYLTADGHLGRYLPDDWRPGGIQGFR